MGGSKNKSNTPFELHVWGPLGTLPSFSAECLAAIWYITQAVPVPEDGDGDGDNNEYIHDDEDENETVQFNNKNTVLIYQTSNTGISPSGVLPALRHDGQVYSGYTSILRYLKSLGYDLDAAVLTSSELNTKLPAALAYLDTNLAGISQYLTYVQSKNYERVTRPLLSKLIPFPMQYIVPLKEKSIAEAQCLSLGLHQQEQELHQQKKQQQDDLMKKYPSLSKLQEQLEDQKKKRELSIKEAKESMRMIVYAHEVFDNITRLGIEDDEQGETETEGEGEGESEGEFNRSVGPNAVQLQHRHEHVWKLFSRLSSADLLLLAHLIIQTNSELPYSPIRSLLEAEYPQLVNYIERNVTGLNDLKMNIQEPKYRDLPTVFNSAYNWAASLLEA